MYIGDFLVVVVIKYLIELILKLFWFVFDVDIGFEVLVFWLLFKNCIDCFIIVMDVY